MKSLYFQTVGIECKFYENQQLEYRLYSWGRSVFEKSFLQIVTHILQKTFLNTFQEVDKTVNLTEYKMKDK